jgi:rare lipoprotein A
MVQLMAMQAQEEFGIASYYADAFHGRKTASGDLYHKDKLTAAHKTLPFGTVVRVTRLDNKKSVKVTINDRGPYIKGRIVDVSKAAAKQLDLITDGKARVKIEVLSKGEEKLVAETIPDLRDLRSKDVDEAKAKANVKDIPKSFNDDTAERLTPKAATPPPAETNTNVKPSTPNLTVKSPEKKAAPAKKPTPKLESPAKKETMTAKGNLVTPQDFKVHDLYKIQLMRPEKNGFGVQVASMSQYESVMKQVADLQGKWFNNILVSVEKNKAGETSYKLILGPFPDRATADSYKEDLKKKKKMDGFVVDLSSLQK